MHHITRFVPYLRRADELESLSPSTAHFCLSFVIEKLRDECTEDEDDLSELLSQLVERANVLKEKYNNISIDDCISVTKEIMSAAELEEDLKASVDKFFIASTLYDVLAMFDDDESHITMRNYAKFRAAERARMYNSVNSDTVLDMKHCNGLTNGVPKV